MTWETLYAKDIKFKELIDNFDFQSAAESFLGNPLKNHGHEDNINRRSETMKKMAGLCYHDIIAALGKLNELGSRPPTYLKAHRQQIEIEYNYGKFTIKFVPFQYPKPKLFNYRSVEEK